MRNLKVWACTAALAAVGLGGVAQADDNDNNNNNGFGGPDKLLVTVTSDDTHTQGMSMILATQAAERGQEVRVLICGKGTEMAVGRYRGESLEPAGANPQQMLKQLIEEYDVTAEVCGVFLPNTRYKEENLIDGVGVASPEDIGEYMADPKVRFFTH
ncbi:hypothetical protein HH1059_08090 [Halorhodospira halochloris]|uniref:Uncharacterized protein n=1 Tax=Halorhodospira halochloris TaxID=1052 RepID=A0A0X8X8R7_HALHR|nr:DsrE family protein [Halorhodospira halochloris]MBK1651226.1 hypothetical protein [Halorhodospira halochloris]MCG5547629.1 DsrE family protein [Halorhodospira halochloris]BAU57499.1 hypothetical protein HH1059_08090 [Halorhodospira halochloris]